MGALAIHLLVGVIELLTWFGLVLAHVHGHLVLTTLCALHVVLLISRELVRVDHGQHLGEALSYACNSLSRVTERKLIPRHELDPLSVHIDKTLFARSARETTQRLFAEHGIFFVVAASFAHDQVVEVLELFLVDLECLASIGLVSELLLEHLDDFAQTVL